MQKYAKDACEEIDAGIFSGDTFDKIDELNELNHGQSVMKLQPK